MDWMDCLHVLFLLGCVCQACHCLPVPAVSLGCKDGPPPLALPACRMEAKLREMEQRMQLGVGATAASAIVTPVADDGTKMFRFDDSLASAAELANTIASSTTANGSAGTNGSSKKVSAVNGHASQK